VAAAAAAAAAAEVAASEVLTPRMGTGPVAKAWCLMKSLYTPNNRLSPLMGKQSGEAAATRQRRDSDRTAAGTRDGETECSDSAYE